MVKSNMLIFTFGFFVLILLSLGQDFTFRVPLPLALLYAFCTLMSQICLMKAMQYGPISLSSLFYSFGFIIPTIWGSFHYKEELKVLHFIGLSLIILSFVLSGKDKTDEDKKATINLKWLFFAFGGLFFSGLVGVIQKLFASDFSGYSLSWFLSLSFLFIVAFCGVLFFVTTLIEKCKEKNSSYLSNSKSTPKKNNFNQKSFVFTMLLGFCMGAINKMNTFLSGKLPSIIVFPILNGGGIILTTLISLLIFKEKISLKQKLGVGVGVLAIVFIAFA